MPNRVIPAEQTRNVDAAIHRLSSALGLAGSSYLRPGDAATLVARDRQRIPNPPHARPESKVRVPTLATMTLSAANVNSVRSKPIPIRHARPFPTTPLPSSHGLAVIAEHMHPDSALRLIESILQRVQGGRCHVNLGLPIRESAGRC